MKVEGGKLVAKVWPALTEAIEAGVAYGIRRAYKHREDPEPSDELREALSEAIADAVLSEICERFTIEEAPE